MEDRAKQASAMSVFLLEELGDARLRCSQLKKYLEQANTLIDASEHREHFIEVAGHLIYGIPETLLKMEKALHAAAMAAARWDYEEIKDDLRPEKVDELEMALEDIRVRRVRRQTREAADRTALMADRSDSAFKSVLLPILRRETLKALEESVTELMVYLARMRSGHGGVLTDKILLYRPDDVELSVWIDHVEEAMEAWFSTQKRSLRQAKETPMKTHEAAEQLERIASSIEQAGQVDTQALSRLIAALEGAGNQRTASSKLGIASALRDISASLLSNTDPQSRPSRMSLAAALRRVLGDSLDVQKTASDEKESRFEEGKPADPTKEMSEEDAKEWKANTDKYEDKFKAASDEKESRFEEGKPADPTENMSEDDAKKWKVEHDKNKDNFKAAGKQWTKQQVKKVMDQQKIPGELNGSGSNWSVELPDEAAKDKFEKHVDADFGGYRTGYGGWVLSPGHKSDEHDFNSPYSKHHYASDEKESRFEEGKPADPTKEMSEEDAKKWKANTDKYEDKFTKEAFEMDSKKFERVVLPKMKNVKTPQQYYAVIDELFEDHKITQQESRWLEEDAEGYEKMMAEFKAEGDALRKKKHAGDEKESRFEEGKPADPTKEMSEEDAKKWKSNTDKYEDKFKSASIWKV